MATMSAPVWTPNPVTGLPSETKVTFSVVPGRGAVATRVQYSLDAAAALKFIAPDSGLVRPEETAASAPAPTPKQRSPLIVVDTFNGLPASGTATTITRGLGINKAGGTPGFVTLDVTVVDILASGELTGKDSIPAQVFFKL